MMSSFLSPDNYMQDPLKYVDPSGENGNEPQGNSSGNHGSPGGSLDGPNNKRSSVIIRTVTIDNNLHSICNFLIFNSDESSGNNTSYFSDLYNIQQLVI